MGRHPRYRPQRFSFPHRMGEGGRRPDGRPRLGTRKPAPPLKTLSFLPHSSTALIQLQNAVGNDKIGNLQGVVRRKVLAYSTRADFQSAIQPTASQRHFTLRAVATLFG